MAENLSMAAGLPLADTPDAASKWWVPAMQSVVLCLLFAAMSVAGLSLYVVVPLALLAVWLPRTVRSRQPLPRSAVGNSDIALLTRDLSRTTSHNALSAARWRFPLASWLARCNRNWVLPNRSSAVPSR